MVVKEQDTHLYSFFTRVLREDDSSVVMSAIEIICPLRNKACELIFSGHLFLEVQDVPWYEEGMKPERRVACRKRSHENTA
jgi:hypothetical protein